MSDSGTIFTDIDDAVNETQESTSEHAGETAKIRPESIEMRSVPSPLERFRSPSLSVGVTDIEMDMTDCSS